MLALVTAVICHNAISVCVISWVGTDVHVAMAMLLTVFFCLVSGYTRAIQRKIVNSFFEKVNRDYKAHAVRLENKAHFGTLWNIEHTFPFGLRWYGTAQLHGNICMGPRYALHASCMNAFCMHPASKRVWQLHVPCCSFIARFCTCMDIFCVCSGRVSHLCKKRLGHVQMLPWSWAVPYHT